MTDPMAERDQLIQLGSDALARGAFREAHDHWEAAWRRSMMPDRPVVQALAQLAAALVHLGSGRPRGAPSILARAHRKLMLPDTPRAVGAIEVVAVRAAIERLQGDLAGGRVPDLRGVSLG